MESRRLLTVSFSFQSFLVGGNEAVPSSIVTGPDGNIWFTQSYYSNGVETDIAGIGEVNVATGALSKYSTQIGGDRLGSIIVGPGGDLWFTDNDGLGSIDPATHVIKQYPLGITNAKPVSVALGPDGNLWFTDQNNVAVGVFNPTTHTASEYPLPRSTDRPSEIVAGPDGNLWFTEGLINPQTPAFGSVLNINPTTHAFTRFATQQVPGSITLGPDGNLWFIDEGFFPNPNYPNNGRPEFGTKVGEVNPATGVVTEYQGGGGGIVSGPIGDLWYNEPFGSIDPTTHVTTQYAVPNVSLAGAITAGPNNSLWLGGSHNNDEGKDLSYLVSATVIPSNQAAIAGYAYLDPTGTGTTANGILAYQTVFLDLMGDGKLDPGDPITNTDAFGYYTFTGLTPGAYTVRIAPYPGNLATSPAGGGRTVTVTVSGGQLGTAGPLGFLPSSTLLPVTFNPTPFGTHNPDVQTADVNGLYQLILGRAPDASGGPAAVSYLKNGGSLAQLAGDLLTSVEYDTRAVNSYYQSFLGRAPDSGGGAAAVAYLQHGGSFDSLASGLMSSAEFRQIHASSTDFVQALYNDILGRQGSAPEVAAWAALATSDANRNSIVHDILNSTEAKTRIAVGAYGILLARPLNSDGLNSVVSYLQNGGTEVGLATILTSSSEFVAKANATVR